MSRLERLRRTLLGSVLALAVVAGAAPFAQAEPVGAVEELRGAASATIGASQRSLVTAAPVFRRELVRTQPASRVTLALGRNTTLRLGASTEIQLVDYVVDAGGVIDLLDGAMVFERPEDTEATPVRVNSDYGLIAVRGTVFFAGPSDGVFGVFVVRGSVGVAAGGSSVILNRGEGTNIAEPGDAPSPPARWSRERIDAALASVR